MRELPGEGIMVNALTARHYTNIRCAEHAPYESLERPCNINVFTRHADQITYVYADHADNFCRSFIIRVSFHASTELTYEQGMILSVVCCTPGTIRACFRRIQRSAGCGRVINMSCARGFASPLCTLISDLVLVKYDLCNLYIRASTW